MAKNALKRAVNLDDEAVKYVLSALLQEFKERMLGTDALRQSYQGLAPTLLKQACLAGKSISEVDFDLAMQALADGKLVKTGPMEMVDNPPGASIVFIGMRSRNEYAYLTEDGYRAATSLSAVKLPRSKAANIHFTGNTFHGSQVGVGGTVSQTADFSTTNVARIFNQLRDEIVKVIDDESKRAYLLEGLDRLETAKDKPSKMQLYNQFVGAVGDHITVLQFLLPPLLAYIMS